jgi:tryptophan-rich sensory protein
MKITNILKLVASIILCQLAGFIGSLATVPAIPTWYESLKRPSFNPPNWIFGPVWTGLYTLMGISLFIVWQKRADYPQVKPALGFFFIQLILNALWSVAFFGLRSPLLGLIDIVLLWIAILLTIKSFFKILKTAALLLLPYILWVSFAVLLNFSLWILNP